MDKISIEDFAKLDLRVGEILEVEEHPRADKLLILKVDFGSEIGERTIVAGLRNYYSVDELEGKKAVFIVNILPRKMMGIESNGMILAAADDEKSKVVFVEPEKDIDAGSKIGQG